jgi:hypothetical protein
MPGVSALKVDLKSSGDFLVTPRGNAVWPGSDGDLKAIERRAALFSVPIDYVTGRIGRTRPKGGLVVGLGPKAKAAGELFAHLTSRAYAYKPHPGDLVGDVPPDVLVTTWSSMTYSVLNWLYSGERRSAPGIVCASSPGQLRRQVILSAISSVVAPSDHGLTWTGVSPTRGFETRSIGSLHVLGSAAPAQAVRTAMGGGSGVLAVSSHGDGVDVFLGETLALCPLDRGVAEAGRRRAPSCCVRGICHRHGQPTELVAGTDLVMSPDEVRARIALFDVCYGILAADSLIDPRWALGPRLVANDGIGALVTTWELVLLEPSKLEPLVEDLRRGATVGAAVNRFNRSAASRRTATRLCVFGDPRTRVAPKSPRHGRSVPERIAEPAPHTPVLEGFDDEQRELAFSRACLTKFIERTDEQYGYCEDAVPADRLKMRNSAAWTLDCLLKVERLLWARQRYPGEISRSREVLRRALLADIARRGEPANDWLHIIRRLHWKAAHCRICGSPSRIGTATLGVAGVSKRRITFCPRCRLTEDMPISHDITLQFDPKRCVVSVQGAVVADDWTAGLLIRGRLDSDDMLIAWPAAPDGQPTISMPLSGRFRPVPLTLAFVLICRGKVSWVAQDIHGGQTAPAEWRDEPSGADVPWRNGHGIANGTTN